MLCFVFVIFFTLAQGPSGCQAGFEYSPQFLGGDFAACEPCRLGRGKCRRMCTEAEKVIGRCKLNFLCCRERVDKPERRSAGLWRAAGRSAEAGSSVA